MNDYDNPFNCSPIFESVPKGQVLVVDDDSSCLDIFTGLLNMFNYQVTPAKDPFQALNILQMKEVSFDLVITDIYMPLMNGVVLQQKIEDEFSIPVVLMSEVSDKQKLAAETGLEEESVVMSKPPVMNQVQNLWHFVLIRMKAKNNFKGKKPTQQDQSANVILELENVNNNENEDLSNITTQKKRAKPKTKVVWTSALHNRFLDAIKAIGYDRAVPKKILEHMNVRGLSRTNISSHLQKYRIYMKRIYNACMKIGANGVPLNWNQMSSFTLGEFPDLVHNSFLLNYATAMFMKELQEDKYRSRSKRRRAITQLGQNNGMRLLGNSTNNSGYGIGLSSSLAPPSSQGFGSLYNPYRPLAPLVSPIPSNGTINTIGATSGANYRTSIIGNRTRNNNVPWYVLQSTVPNIGNHININNLGGNSGASDGYIINNNNLGGNGGASDGSQGQAVAQATFGSIDGFHGCLGNNSTQPQTAAQGPVGYGGLHGFLGNHGTGTQPQTAAQGPIGYGGLHGFLGNYGTGTQPQTGAQGPLGYGVLHGGPSNGMGMANNGVVFAAPYQGVGSHQFNGNIPYYHGGMHNFTNCNNMMQQSFVPCNFVGQPYGVATSQVNYMPNHMNQHLGTNFRPYTTPVVALPNYVASSTDPTTTRLSNFRPHTTPVAAMPNYVVSSADPMTTRLSNIPAQTTSPMASMPNFTLPTSFISPMGNFFNLVQQPLSHIATMINLSTHPTTPLGALWNNAAHSSSHMASLLNCGPQPKADLSDFVEQLGLVSDVADFSEQLPSDDNVPKSVDEQPQQVDSVVNMSDFVGQPQSTSHVVTNTLSVEQPPQPVAAATSNMPNSVAQQPQVVSDNLDNLSNISTGNQHVVTSTEQLAVGNQEKYGSSVSNDQQAQEMEGYGFISGTSYHLEDWLPDVYSEYSMDRMDEIIAYLNTDPPIDGDNDPWLGEY